MPRGDKSSYTSKQKRKVEHIEEGYEDVKSDRLPQKKAGKPGEKKRTADDIRFSYPEADGPLYRGDHLCRPDRRAGCRGAGEGRH
jgi:hypothetical protein